MYEEILVAFVAGFVASYLPISFKLGKIENRLKTLEGCIQITGRMKK